MHPKLDRNYASFLNSEFSWLQKTRHLVSGIFPDLSVPYLQNDEYKEFKDSAEKLDMGVLTQNFETLKFDKGKK